MARSFVSHAGVDVVVVDGALLVLYALTLQRLSDTDSDERGAELRELLSMGECSRPPRSAERRREPGLPSSRRDVMRSASA